MNVKIKTEMHGQIISIEFRFSFPTIYINIVCTDGKVPAIIMLLHGGMGSYFWHHFEGGMLCASFESGERGGG